ncbi:hypothetical protein HMF7854_11780 [Sphingomonas ginkgonis]|uniref:O-antigen ligase-related domain-containing protein n=1 Tax=Sphingomonas ginkgonis TaxID=2315330 RepID=A0A429VBW9_9SPHN|nr:O-antigen ligase family protein [Sphingomonas ginkgonis]RST31444.1 hypothetical protein HMF7854_11780 [Sphingomonas ginkgonis]
MGWLTAALFVPLWLSRPLGSGEFSLAFCMPLLLAAWALTRPAPRGWFAHPLLGRRRGLIIEAAAVVSVVVLAFLSMSVSPAPARAFRVILPMIYAPCALILLSHLAPATRRRLIVAMALAGVLVLAPALLLSQSGSGEALVMREYRLTAFFENANQLGVVVLAIWPLAVALVLTAPTARLRLLATGALAILGAAILLSGTKTAMALGFVSGALVWLYHASRSGSLGKTLVTLTIALCLIVLAVPVTLWLISISSPTAFRKVSAILANGVWEYRSIQTRDVIWQESIRLGLKHPLLGTGAGSKVLGYSHSHNMSLDYFRGMGILGLVAALTLLVAVASRTAAFVASTWHKGVVDRSADVVTAAMYLGATFYLVGNQLSDSFSPTTAFPFWMLYLGAYFSTLKPRAVAARARLRRSTRDWSPRASR